MSETAEEKKHRKEQEKAAKEARDNPPPPDMTKAAETVPEAGAAEGVDPSTLSYPPPLKDSPDMKYRVIRWKEEGRVPYAHNRNRKGPQYYYPLNYIRNASNNNQPERITLGDGTVAYRAEYAWDPQHRGSDGEEQYITHAERFPEKKEE